MSDKKKKSILEAQEPENITQLKSFLGMTSFYHLHIPGLWMQSPKLHELLNKGSCWQWSEMHKQEFNKLKYQLQTALTIQSFNLNAEIITVTDATPDGVGAIFDKQNEWVVNNSSVCFSYLNFNRAKVCSIWAGNVMNCIHFKALS